MSFEFTPKRSEGSLHAHEIPQGRTLRRSRDLSLPVEVNCHAYSLWVNSPVAAFTMTVRREVLADEP